jgi:hypothetical protein
MSIALLELGASALGDLAREVVFTGGATIGLWITDPAAPEPRPTEDVDVIVEVTSRGRFADFEQRLRRRRFREDQETGIICRWRHADSDLVLDAMPMDGSILGFENRWQGPDSGVSGRPLPPREAAALLVDEGADRRREP